MATQAQVKPVAKPSTPTTPAQVPVKKLRGKAAVAALTPEERAKRLVAKRMKFRELAETRLTKALKAISLCENLANYNPLPEDAKIVITQLVNAVDAVKHRLETAKQEKTTSAIAWQAPLM